MLIRWSATRPLLPPTRVFVHSSFHPLCFANSHYRSLFKLRDVYQANEEKRKQKWEVQVFEALDFDKEEGLQREGVETLLKGKRILDAYDGIETPLVTDERIDEVFKKFDTNGNGQIEHVEFLKWYSEA